MPLLYWYYLLVKLIELLFVTFGNFSLQPPCTVYETVPNQACLLFSGAVRVDLSYADKTIRRPGSAPELAVKDPVRSVLRRQHTTNEQHRYK